MPHRRDEIRKYIVDNLKHKTSLKENVFNWRVDPVESEAPNSLPCLSVLIPEERAIEADSSGSLIQREADIVIVIYNSIKNERDMMSDVVAREVEKIMNQLNHKDFNFEYKKMDMTTENMARRLLLLCCLHYECRYYTKEIPLLNEEDLDDFENLSVEI